MANHTVRQNSQKSFETGITASTTQTQGSGTITAAINEISTVANDNDTITLPILKEGHEISIINNGDKILQIFPAVGSNLGNGINNPTTLDENEEMKFFATSDITSHIEDTTEIFHAEIHDEDNTVEFTINAQNEQHAYHGSGITSGDLAGWEFNSGSNGIQIVIINITDGTGGTIIVETGISSGIVSGPHGLSVDDIICHTGLSDSNYVGFFKVLAIVDSTHYKVSATYTASGTGFMSEPAHIHIKDIAVGPYMITWTASLSVAGTNVTFDFFLHDGMSIITGSKGRHKIANAASFKMIGGQAVRKVISADRIFFALSNITNTTNLTIRDFSVIVTKL